MEYKICETIRELRRERSIAQDVLAAAVGVSVQAVSKWECGGSLPDILTLPEIARYFGVTTDTLYYGTKKPGELPAESEAAANSTAEPDAIMPPVETADSLSNTNISSHENRNTNNYPIPDDGKLRIIQFSGGRMLARDEYDPNIRIPLEIPQAVNNIPLNIEIWGSADIDGDINGDVSAGGSVNCGDINGGVNAGGCINCGDISGGVNAGGCINCGDISGGVNAGGSINCGDIGGGVNAGAKIECGDIDGDVCSGGNIECGDIDGDVTSGANIECGDIDGDVTSGGYIECGDIEGDVNAGANIDCSDIEGDINITADGVTVTINSGEISGSITNRGSGSVIVN